MKDRILFSLFENDSKLKNADFSNQDFTDAEFEQLCAGIQHNTNVRFLILLYSNISDKQLENLLQAILINDSIQKIKLSKYKDYPQKSLEIIEKIEEHVDDNMRRSK